MIELITAGLLIVTESQAQEEQPSAIAVPASVFESHHGSWEGTGRYFNPRFEEPLEGIVNANCGPSQNETITYCNLEYITNGRTLITHDVYSIFSMTGDLYISYQGITEPIVHRYVIQSFEESVEDDSWSLTVMTTDMVGGQLTDQKLIWSFDGTNHYRETHNRPANTDEDFFLASIVELSPAS